MITPELVNFVKQQVSYGIPKDQMILSLQRYGWTDEDISEAFNFLLKRGAVVMQSPEPIQKKHPVRTFFFFICFMCVVALAIGAFFLYQKNGRLVVSDVTGIFCSIPFDSISLDRVKGFTRNLQSQFSAFSKESDKVRMEDLTVSYVPVPAAANSASLFTSISPDTFTDEDKEFLYSYSVRNTPPLPEARAMLTKYASVLEIFDAGISFEQYQCSKAMGEVCSSDLYIVAHLAALRSFVMSAEGKTDEALQYAFGIVRFGQMLSAHADDSLVLLSGWSAQKLGYEIMSDLSTHMLAEPQKDSYIRALRDEQKYMLQSLYTRYMDAIAYVQGDISELPYVADVDTARALLEYRESVNTRSWDPDKTKELFYNSLRIALLNADASCESKTQNSLQLVNFDLNNTRAANYIGKAVYTTLYTPLDSLHVRRCEVERLIQAL